MIERQRQRHLKALAVISLMSVFGSLACLERLNAQPLPNGTICGRGDCELQSFCSGEQSCPTQYPGFPCNGYWKDGSTLHTCHSTTQPFNCITIDVDQLCYIRMKCACKFNAQFVLVCADDTATNGEDRKDSCL
jgi:hypothetical protein